MSDFILSCCSTADMTKDYFEERDIHYARFHYIMDEVTYVDDLWQSMDNAEFYQRMVDGADTKTSQINVEEFTAYFRPFLQEGKDILHLTLSSGITGVFNSANLAKDILLEEFPERKIIIIDSLAASSGFGLLMDKLADLRDEGKSMEEIASFAEANKLKLNHWFFSTDLTFFIKGGRVSKAAGLVGGMLNICPLLNVSVDGKLIPRKKIRTKKKVIREIAAMMEEKACDGSDYSGKCYISHSACLEDAQAVAALVEEKFPKLDGNVRIMNIGPTIGAHTGPGTVALFFWGNERID